MLTKILLALAILGAVQALPWDPVSRPDDWWQERHAGYLNYTKYQRDNINVLFFGDSITEGWPDDGKPIWDGEYGPWGVAGYGIGGDRVENVLWRVINGEVEGLHPKVVVLKIGTNNWGESSDNVVIGITALVVELRVRVPDAKIILLGILPRNDADNDQVFTWIRDINIKISHLADGAHVFWLDMFNQFAVSWPTIDQSLYKDDKVHLMTSGYYKWADTMRSLFNKLVNA